MNRIPEGGMPKGVSAKDGQVGSVKEYNGLIRFIRQTRDDIRTPESIRFASTIMQKDTASLNKAEAELRSGRLSKESVAFLLDSFGEDMDPNLKADLEAADLTGKGMEVTAEAKAQKEYVAAKGAKSGLFAGLSEAKEVKPGKAPEEKVAIQRGLAYKDGEILVNPQQLNNAIRAIEELVAKGLIKLGKDENVADIIGDLRALASKGIKQIKLSSFLGYKIPNKSSLSQKIGVASSDPKDPFVRYIPKAAEEAAKRAIEPILRALDSAPNVDETK